MEIHIKNLGKQIKGVWVLRNITVSFESGKIYGLIGRNGSGKTMLMRTICGLASYTEGEITVNGLKLGEQIDIPDSIGAIIEVPGFLENKTGIENLRYLASLTGKATENDIQKAMQRCGLDPSNRKKVHKYSLGMRQRLGIAQAIMENPDALLLDEPMNGLDNQGVCEIKELLKELRNNQKTIIIASHHMEDIEELCDAVYLLNSGKLFNRDDHQLL